MHPLGHLSGKAAQNKWKTKWQFSRKAVFLTLQLKHFKPGTVFSTSSFLLCLELYKLSNVCGWGSSERLFPVHTWKLLLRGVKSNGGNLPSLPAASAGSTEAAERLCCAANPQVSISSPISLAKRLIPVFGELWKPNPVPSLVPLVPPPPHPSPTDAVLGLQLWEHKPTAPIPAMYKQLSIASADGFGH